MYDFQNKKYMDWSDEDLWKAYKAENSLELKQELAVRYLDVVRRIAVQMRNVYVSFAQLDDIINEGVIVVMSAIDKFDSAMNVKFETFVSKRIRGMIIDMARKQDWVPRGVRKLTKEADEVAMMLYGRDGRMPSPEETAAYMNIPLEKYEKVMGRADLFYALSLDMLLEEKTDNRQSLQIPSQNMNEQPEERFLGNEMRKIMADGIASLKENEQTVISLYYVEELSAREIAKILGVSAPRISQIHANAIRKLRIYIEKETS